MGSFGSLEKVERAPTLCCVSFSAVITNIWPGEWSRCQQWLIDAWQPDRSALAPGGKQVQESAKEGRECVKQAQSMQEAFWHVWVPQQA